jgi:hypothetical protein
MLISSVNATFNTALADCAKVQCMHESMSRLLTYAREATKAAAPSGRLYSWTEIGARLDVTSAVITNWKKRGISRPGAFDAQRRLGCNAWWLLEGEGSTYVVDPDPTLQSLVDAARQLSGARRAKLLMMAEALLPEDLPT